MMEGRGSHHLGTIHYFPDEPFFLFTAARGTLNVLTGH